MNLQLWPDNDSQAHPGVGPSGASPSNFSASEASPGIILQVRSHPDGSLTCVSVSRSCQEFLAVSATAIKADFNALLALIHPGDRPSFQSTQQWAIQTQQDWIWEGRLVLATGQTRWVQWRGEIEVEGPTMLWTGVMVDITSQRQTNAQVERLSFLLGLTERIQISTDLYEISQFALNYLVQVTNCAFGDIKVVSEVGDSYQANAIQNYISGEFVATYGEPAVAEMAAALDQGQPYGKGLLWQVVETGQPLYIEDYANHPQACPAFQHPAIGQIAIFPIPALDGTIIGVLTLEARNLQPIHDLPQQDMLLAACRILGARIEWAQAQERLRKANANLEQTSDQLRQQTAQLAQALSNLQQTQLQLVQTEKMSSLGQLVAGVAHEINNPINFIYGNLTYATNYTRDLLQLLQLYQQACPQPPEVIQSLTTTIDLDFVLEDFPKILASMKVGAERVRQIVLSLRNFSRLDEAEMKQIDLHEGLDSTLMLLQHRLKERNGYPLIQVERDYGALPLVQCYAGQLNQVFMNILTNAVDALEDGRDATVDLAKIEIQTRLLDGMRVEIRIRDNGPGMSDAVKQRLFDPFFTTKPVGKGTGLGMAISYQIVVEKHGGQLHCQSTPGQGTEFLIHIPVQQEAES